MLSMTREWVKKAEGDFDVILLPLRSRKPSRFDPICFHCQQCVEKYLKARLTEANILFPKSHDLIATLNLLLAVEPLWSAFLREFQAITDWAVLPRYPGSSANTDDAKEAVRICRRFRTAAKAALGLPP